MARQHKKIEEFFSVKFEVVRKKVEQETDVNKTKNTIEKVDKFSIKFDGIIETKENLLTNPEWMNELTWTQISIAVTIVSIGVSVIFGLL